MPTIFEKIRAEKKSEVHLPASNTIFSRMREKVTPETVDPQKKTVTTQTETPTQKTEPKDSSVEKTVFSAMRRVSAEAEAESSPKTVFEAMRAKSDDVYASRSYKETDNVVRKFSLKYRNKTVEVLSKMAKGLAKVPGFVPTLNLLQQSTELYGKDKAIKNTSLMEFLTTPTGKALTGLAIKTTPFYVFEKLNVPEKFPIPENTKYSPQIRKLIELSGGNMEDVQDRLATALGIETLVGLGFGKVVDVVRGVSGKGAPKAINNLLELSEDSLDILRKETAAVERATDRVRAKAAHKLATKEIKSAPARIISKDLSPEEIAEAISLNDTVINGTKYSVNGKGIHPYKLANYDEAVADTIKNTYIRKLTKAPKNIRAVLPQPGNWRYNANDWDTKGIMLWTASPVQYAPNVDRVIGVMEQSMVRYTNRLWSKLKPFEKLEGTEKGRLAAIVADGLPEAKEILASGRLGDDGLKAVRAAREIAEEMANAEGIPREKRISGYLHHVVEDYKERDFPMPSELKTFVKEWEPYKKKRRGAPKYVLDIVKATRIRLDYSARAVHTKAYKQKIWEAVKELGDLNPESGDMARCAVDNYFGTLNKATPSSVRRASQALKSAWVRGTLFWNFRTPIRNLTQTLTLGVQEVGLAAIKDGTMQMSHILRNTRRGKALKKFMDNTGLFVSKSKNELLRSDPGAMRKVLEKVVGKKVARTAFEDGANWQQMSEEINKSIVYLGRYRQVSKKIKRVKVLGEGKLPKTEQWLKLRGINPLGAISVECHAAARRAALKTQFDYTRWGQTLLTRNPILSPYLVYTTWPLKANEYVLRNAKNTLKYLAKNPKLALQMPETQSTMRWGMQMLFSKAFMATTGVSLFALTGIHGVSGSPLLDTMGKTLDAIESLTTLGPRAAENALRMTATLTGFPLTAPIWRIKELLRVTKDNEGVSGDWEIKSKYSGRVLYKENPMVFFFTTLTGIGNAQTAEEYHKRKAELKFHSRMLKNVGKRLDEKTGILPPSTLKSIRGWSKKRQKSLTKEQKRARN